MDVARRQAMRLRPRRVAGAVRRRVAAAAHGAFRRARERRAARHFGDIRRGSRDRCFCGGELRALARYPSFGTCVRCGTHVNMRPPLAGDLTRLYSLDLYWHRRQRAKGYPPLEERAELYRTDGRLDAWLRLVDTYGPPGRAVVEVGCAPGVLLAELAGRGYDCMGVEVDPAVAAWMEERWGLEIRPGLFPAVELPPCDLFLAFDTLEHTPDPPGFVRAAARLLRPGGVAILQTAIDRYDYDRPFGPRSDLFDDLEHLFLFTDRALEELAARAGLEVESLDERLWVGGEVGVLRKPA